MHGLTVAWGLLKNRELRRLLTALVAFALTEHGTWLAIMVFAYRRGGVGETGIVLFAALIPAAIVAPLAARSMHPTRAGHTLVRGFAVQSGLLVIAAAVVSVDAPAGVVYVAILSSSVALVLTRPAAAALVPSLARSVEELTAANAATGLVAMVGLFVGPAVAGVLLAATSVSAVFWVTAVLMAGAALVSLSLRSLDDDIDLADADDDQVEPDASLSDADVPREQTRSIRLVIAVQALVFAMIGALDVAFVATAVELVGRSEAAAGALNAAHGFGAFLGAIATLALVGQRRLTPTIVGAVCAIGIAVAALSQVTVMAVAIVLFAVTGVGRAISGVAGRTMLQGLSPSHDVARIFGVLEGLSMFALAIGALGFSLAADAFGLKAALVGAGAVLPISIVLSLRELMAIDGRRPAVDAELVGILRATPVFGPLPPYAVEHLLANLGRQTFGPDEAIITAGDHGDEIYVLVTGDAVVHRITGETRPLGTGDYFGEIALLFDRPRTASVVAGPDGATVLTLDRDTYRTAIGVNPRSHGRVTSIARGLLRGDGIDR